MPNTLTLPAALTFAPNFNSIRYLTLPQIKILSIYPHYLNEKARRSFPRITNLNFRDITFNYRVFSFIPTLYGLWTELNASLDRDYSVIFEAFASVSCLITGLSFYAALWNAVWYRNLLYKVTFRYKKWNIRSFKL